MQAESLISNKRGFTLLEVVIVGSIFTIGILGVLGLISQSISFSSVTSDRLIASYLAQEGVEIVQNIRDTNFIEGAAWDDGLTGCALGCEADYTSDALVSGPARFLNVDSDNLYTYAAGTATRLKRKIEIQDISPSAKRVIVTVSWEGKNAGNIVLDADMYKYVIPDPHYEYEAEEITPFE